MCLSVCVCAIDVWSRSSFRVMTCTLLPSWLSGMWVFFLSCTTLVIIDFSYFKLYETNQYKFPQVIKTFLPFHLFIRRIKTTRSSDLFAFPKLSNWFVLTSSLYGLSYLKCYNLCAGTAVSSFSQCPCSSRSSVSSSCCLCISSVNNMLEALGWPTLEQRRQTCRLLMLYKIQSGLAHCPTLKAKLVPLPSRHPWQTAHSADHQNPV